MDGQTAAAVAIVDDAAFGGPDGGNLGLDVSHLGPCIVECTLPKRAAPITIEVKFSNHCYTEKWDEALHVGREVLLDGGGRPRAVCPVRLEQSRRLPELILRMLQAHVYQTPEANYVCITSPEGEEYRIYFNLKRSPAGAPAQLTLFVESAYSPRAGALPPQKMTKVRFVILAEKTLLGQRVRRHTR